MIKVFIEAKAYIIKVEFCMPTACQVVVAIRDEAWKILDAATGRRLPHNFLTVSYNGMINKL